MSRSEPHSAHRLDRRAMFTLGGVGLAGWAVGRVLARAGSIGRDVRASGAVTSILADTAAPTIGPPAASLRLAVFSDYRCSACRHAFPALETAIKADGDVRLLYKDWPIFGAPSMRAAQVALASSAQGIYPAVHQRLMTAPGAIDDTLLRTVITDVGGDWQRLLSDLDAGRARIDAQLQRHAREARAIGLPGTPGYLAGALLVLGAIDATDFARLFAQARHLQGEGGAGAGPRFSGLI